MEAHMTKNQNGNEAQYIETNTEYPGQAYHFGPFWHAQQGYGPAASISANSMAIYGGAIQGYTDGMHYSGSGRGGIYGTHMEGKDKSGPYEGVGLWIKRSNSNGPFQVDAHITQADTGIRMGESGENRVVNNVTINCDFNKIETIDWETVGTGGN